MVSLVAAVLGHSVATLAWYPSVKITSNRNSILGRLDMNNYITSFAIIVVKSYFLILKGFLEK